MLWKLNSEGEPGMVMTKLVKSSSFGFVSVYEIGGQLVMETSDIVAMGITRDKFLKQEMPKIRKSLGIQEPRRNAIMRKGKMGEQEEEEKSKDFFKLIQPDIEIEEKEKPKELFKLKKPMVKNNG